MNKCVHTKKFCIQWVLPTHAMFGVAPGEFVVFL